MRSHMEKHLREQIQTDMRRLAAKDRLMAAAPELMEALKETLEYLHCKVHSGHNHYLSCDCCACQTYRKAKTAIAKAEGGKP